MARFYPATVSENVPSNAERKLFRRMQALGDDWIILHSVGLARHITKPWAQIDFILIGPPGVFCLEVKGGRVQRSHGMWNFTDRTGKVCVKQEGPFDQVGSASSALYSFLISEQPVAKHCPVGYGCAFPDITFDLSEPDILLETVYDERDHGRPFRQYLERLAKYWKVRLGKTHVLSDSEKTSVLKAIRPDFDLRPSLARTAAEINETLLQLTSEQYEALDLLSENERILIRGGAGTGKTLLAVEEVKRQSDMGKKVLYCCFNRLLREHVGQTLAAREPRAHTFTVHGLMHKYIMEAQLIESLPPACEEDLFTKFYPEAACTALSQLCDAPPYDVLVLDETQDLLDPNYLDFLDLLVQGGFSQGHWRAFYDPKQDLYVSGGGRIKALTRYQPARATLTVNCRNTLPIATHTSLLSGFELSEVLRVDGPDVEITYYSDSADACKHLQMAVKNVLLNKIPVEEIVILVPSRKSVDFLRRNLNLQVPIAELRSASQRIGTIGIATISSFKGLERDCVILADLESLEGVEMSQLLYVGASRPRVLLKIHVNVANTEWFARQAQHFGQRLAGPASTTT
jgi:hypothetical protein